MTDTPHRRGADRTDAILRATLDLGQEIGYAKLSMEAVATRAGASKQTIYRRWSSKAALLLDAMISLNEPALDYPVDGDVVDDLRTQIRSTVDLMTRPPVGPLFKALIAEAQHNPQIAASLNERFITPQALKTVARLRIAREEGQLSPAFDLDLAMAILSGPLYFQFLIAQEPLTHAYVDRLLDALFAGLGPDRRSR